MNNVPTFNTSRLSLIILISLLILLIGAILILASVPPISRDALTHHLFIPKLYIQHGSIYEIPEIGHSYYPMLLDLFYTVPLALGNDIIPKYIHFFFALFTAWLIFDYLKTRLNQYWGLIGALFFLSLPIIIKLSITVYVDLGLVAFSTASLLMLFKWVDNKKIKYLIYAGVFCGLAASTKYNGLITIFLLTLFTPIIYSRSTVGTRKHSSLRAIGYGAVFIFCAILTFSPWMIRNYTWTGNPVYPLYNSIFQNFQPTAVNLTPTVPEQTIDKTKKIAKQLTSRGSNVLANRKVLYHETWWQAILLPVRFFFEGRDDNPRYFDGKLNPFLFCLSFCAFFLYRFPRNVKVEIYLLFSFAWLYFLFAFFQGSLRIRYIVPSIPALVILATYGMHNLSQRIRTYQTNKRYFHAIIMGCILIPLFLYNAFYIAGQFLTIQPLTYHTGKVTRDEFISKFRSEYPIQQYANKHLKNGDKILAINVGNRGYYFDFPVIFDQKGNRSLLGDIIDTSGSHDEVYQKLLNQGFSHLFIRFDLFRKIASENWSSGKINIFNKFITQNTKQLAANSEYGLFQLVSNSSKFK
ncbi:MAG: hypothetical protein ACI8PB_002496 [Desulforhopalus sp.]|jgi:hypothetical protein